MNPPKRFVASLMCLTAGLAACESAAPRPPTDGGCPTGWTSCPGGSICAADAQLCPALDVQPSDAHVPLRGSVRFAASRAVSWTIEEGAAAGEIDADGTYRAPFAGGTFHVVASVDGSPIARAAVTVGPSVLELAAGKIGSVRSVDGVGSEARLGGWLSGWAADGSNGGWFCEGTPSVDEPRLAAGGVIRHVDLTTGEVRTVASIAGEDAPSQVVRVGDLLWVSRRAELWSVDPSTGQTQLLLADPLGDVYYSITALGATTGAVYVLGQKRIVRVDRATLAVTPVVTADEFAASVTDLATTPLGPYWRTLTVVDDDRIVALFAFSRPLGSAAMLHYTTTNELRLSTLEHTRLFTSSSGTDWVVAARPRPAPAEPDGYEWQFLFHDANWGETIFAGVANVSVSTDAVFPCSVSCDDYVYSFAGEELGALTGIGYDTHGLVAIDPARHAVMRLDSHQTADVLVASAVAGAGSDDARDGTLTGARLSAPGLLTVVDGQRLLVIDHSSEQALRELELDRDEVHTRYHDGVAGGLPDVWNGWTSTIPHWAGGIAATDGRVWLSMPDGNSVYALDTSTTPWRRVALFGYAPEPGLVEGAPTVARFHTPRGLAADGHGGVYVADAGNGCVRRIDAAGMTSTVACGLDTPLALAGDGADTLFVAEATRLRKITLSSAELSTVSETGWSAIASIALHAGVLYVADAGARRVRAFDVATGATIDLAGDPNRQVVITGELPGALAQPAGIAVLPSGEILVADATDHALLRIR